MARTDGQLHLFGRHSFLRSAVERQVPCRLRARAHDAEHVAYPVVAPALDLVLSTLRVP
jgi:hypothetical protein